MRFGIRKDFYEDILCDFDGCRTRFARDVKEMNAYVLAGGLPPVVREFSCCSGGSVGS